MPGPLDALTLDGLEFQRKANFRVVFSGPASFSSAGILLEDISLMLQTAPRTTEENEEIEIQYGNSRIYRPGKLRYEAGRFDVRDGIDKAAARSIRAWRNLVCNYDTSNIGLITDFSVTAKVVPLQPNGADRSDFYHQLINCWPQRVEWGDFDHTSNEYSMIGVTFRFDRSIPRLTRNAV